ncbi:DUF1365 domain-containing protein [Polycladidibacter hongkongensis]|uniref:DUF1365 domain-containing protein n=1 Tax=Polycladidibacter hongkongensis TaxID=1647556 RepID=UPI000A556836|nr:DUF1365 domain-containing protein [Pseudovibrio hongkongensis]
MGGEGQGCATHLRFYLGSVVHKRFTAPMHRFQYRSMMALVKVIEREGARAGWRRGMLFGYERWALFRFYERDYMPASSEGLQHFLQAQLESEGYDGPDLVFYALTMPRFLGRAFNPLTVFYAVDPTGQLRAVLYQVSNTFGERYTYIAFLHATSKGELAGGARLPEHWAEKIFHVSPFLENSGRYRFRTFYPGQLAQLSITLEQEGRQCFYAGFKGREIRLGGLWFWLGVLRGAVSRWRVLGLIHYEALKIWRKGAKLKRKPPPPRVPHSLARAVDTKED